MPRCCGTWQSLKTRCYLQVTGAELVQASTSANGDAEEICGLSLFLQICRVKASLPGGKGRILIIQIRL